MRKTQFFNNISEELEKQIPRLKPNEVVTFQMLNGMPNPDPDEREKSKEPMIYGKIQLRTNFTIYDKYKNANIEIGCVDIWNGDRPARFRHFVPGMGEASRFQGKFGLTGGNGRDEELYEILWLSPEREGSPCADSGIAPKFRILDLKADSKTSVNKFDTLKKAIDLADAIKPEKAKQIMAALNQPNYKEEEVLLSKTKDLARTKPDLFIQTYNNPEIEIISIVKQAIDEALIDHDIITGQVKLGGMVIATLKLAGSESFPHEFTKWIVSSENGKDVLNNIQGRLQKQEELAIV